MAAGLEEFSHRPWLSDRRLGYHPALDGVRALAIGAVIAYHTKLQVFAGAQGVAWFFVLSGFLITRLLLEEHVQHGVISLKSFYIRRGIRLAPTLLLVLAVMVPLGGTLNGTKWSILLIEAALAATYLTNLWPLIVGTRQHEMFEHTWTLALEEQFYLLWPAALRRLLRRGGISRTAIRWLVIGPVLLAIFERIYSEYVSPLPILSLPLFKLDGFAIGAYLALTLRTGTVDERTVQRQQRVFNRTTAVVAVCVMAAGAPFGTRLPVFATVLLQEVVVAVLIGTLVLAPRTGVSRLLAAKPLVYIGKISYGLYLWHQAIFVLFSNAYLPHVPYPIRQLLKIPLSFAIAVLSYELFEKRIQRRRARHRMQTMPSVPLPEPVRT